MEKKKKKPCYARCGFYFLILIEKQQCAIFLSIEQEDTHTNSIIFFRKTSETDSNKAILMSSKCSGRIIIIPHVFLHFNGFEFE